MQLTCKVDMLLPLFAVICSRNSVVHGLDLRFGFTVGKRSLCPPTTTVSISYFEACEMGILHI